MSHQYHPKSSVFEDEVMTVPWILYGHMFSRMTKTFTALDKHQFNISAQSAVMVEWRHLWQFVQEERCVCRAAYSFIPVHVGKLWSNIAIAAIVLCTTDSCHYCSILYIYTVLILDGILWRDVLCSQHVIYFASSYLLRIRKRSASAQSSKEQVGLTSD